MTIVRRGESTLLLTQDFPPDRGGMARFYDELFRRIEHVQISTMAPCEPGVVHRDDIHRMPFERRKAHLPANIVRWARWADQHVSEYGTSVVHVGNVRSAGYIGAWLRRRRQIPYIVYAHGKDLLKERRKALANAVIRLGTREILGNAAAIVVNSASTADLARDLLSSVGCDAATNRVHVVHPGTDPVRFRPSARAVPSWKPNEVDRPPVLLSVGRLVPRKGIDTTIAALPAILERYPNVTYVVVGTGPDQARLACLAAELGVARSVTFLGDVTEDELPACYAAADIFVLPVRTITADDEIEGFGIVYVEASASGLPCVATTAGGVADAVGDEVTGLLVPPADSRALADALLRLLDDPELRARLGSNGRCAVETHFHWDRAAREVTEIARELREAR